MLFRFDKYNFSANIICDLLRRQLDKDKVERDRGLSDNVDYTI